jgi:predicted transcriptional regulator
MSTLPVAHTAIKDSILDAIGDTPLVRLSRIVAGVRPQVVAKVEALNPGGSIKDRIAVALIEAAERDGKLRPGGTIVEPTSGNTGTGLAIAARLKGYRVIAVMPDKMSKEKIDLLRAYGAEVVVAPTEVAPDSPESYYRVADRLAAEIPGAFQPNQEGILTGGSGGLAMVAALRLAQELEDPGALVAVILPDGGRSYLSKVFNDAWMSQYGFLDRATDQTVGDVLRHKADADEIPPLVSVKTHDKVRDAVALLHEHRVSQLPVVSAHDAHAVVGSVSETGLLRHAVADPQLLGDEVVRVMEAPFPAIAAEDAVTEAVALLAGDRQALLVTVDGRAAGIVTRADLLEALAR